MVPVDRRVASLTLRQTHSHQNDGYQCYYNASQEPSTVPEDPSEITLFGDSPRDKPPYRFVTYHGGGVSVTSEVGGFNSEEASLRYPEVSFVSNPINQPRDLAEFEREAVDASSDSIVDRYPKVQFRSGPQGNPTLANDEGSQKYPY